MTYPISYLVYSVNRIYNLCRGFAIITYPWVLPLELGGYWWGRNTTNMCWFTGLQWCGSYQERIYVLALMTMTLRVHLHSPMHFLPWVLCFSNLRVLWSYYCTAFNNCILEMKLKWNGLQSTLTHFRYHFVFFHDVTFEVKLHYWCWMTVMHENQGLGSITTWVQGWSHTTLIIISNLIGSSCY